MTRREILLQANKMVTGKRVNDYGKPEDNFGCIASLWSAYLGIDISATDVSMLMALLKIARIKSGTATEDSFVDLAGYAACGGEIASGVELTDKTENIENPDADVDVAEKTDSVKESDKTEDKETVTGKHNYFTSEDYCNIYERVINNHCAGNIANELNLDLGMVNKVIGGINVALSQQSLSTPILKAADYLKIYEYIKTGYYTDTIVNVMQLNKCEVREAVEGIKSIIVEELKRQAEHKN